jgi:phosphatidylglycerophosphate synthase
MNQGPLECAGKPAGGWHRAAILDDGRFAVAATAAPAALIASAASLSPAALAVFFTLYLGVAAVVLYRAAQAGHLRRFGWANRITWIRTALATIIASTLFDAGGGVNWWMVSALAAAALALDGLDGRIARRHGRTSRFGALFDQEIDAALILVLCLLLAVSGKIGIWIVALGAMRYVFLVAGRIWPVLAGPLPPSAFRSAVCAIQVAALLICLPPPVAPLAAAWIGGAALGVLVLSFGRDVLWLLTSRSVGNDPSLA